MISYYLHKKIELDTAVMAGNNDVNIHADLVGKFLAGEH